MEGHQQCGYDHMHVIALKSTWEARRLEKRLIIHARGIFGKHRCANKSEDARGQAEGDNFINVVVRFCVTADALSVSDSDLYQSLSVAMERCISFGGAWSAAST